MLAAGVGGVLATVGERWAEARREVGGQGLCGINC